VALVSFKSLIPQYADRHQALLGINFDNPEMLLGILDAAETLGTPLFIQVTPETLALWGHDPLIPWLRHALDRANVPLALHLDHANDLDALQHVLNQGFTSVMYDGSAKSWDDNVQETCRVVDWAKSFDATVEAEIGHVAKPGEPPSWASLTTPEEAQRFAAATGVDLLAVAVGNKHGAVKNTLGLDWDRLEAIHHACPTPLVLHGGSGVGLLDYPALKTRGVVKINVGTALRRLWWKITEDNKGEKPRKLQRIIRDEIQQSVMDILMALTVSEV